jgi:hypothetical protein
MSFNSLIFVVFAAVFFAMWPLANRRDLTRWSFLTFMSLVFYGWWDWRFVFLVLGVTPLSLISGSLGNKHFKQEPSKPAIERGGWLDLEPIRRAFEPLRLSAGSDGAETAAFARAYREGGWMASEGSASPRIALDAYAMLFRRSTFDEANFERLLAALAELRATGVRIVAFRHPSSPEMEALEDRVSGFRGADVRTRLADAGVTWLSFGASGGREFASCDGSHLSQEGAATFGAELARGLASKE